MTAYINAISAYSKAMLNQSAGVNDAKATMASFHELFNQASANFSKDAFEQTAVAPSSTAVSSAAPNLASNMIGDLIGALRASEDVTHKAIEKKASLSEVVTNVTEAGALLKQVVSVGNKFIEAYKQIMSMQI